MTPPDAIEIVNYRRVERAKQKFLMRRTRIETG